MMSKYGQFYFNSMMQNFRERIKQDGIIVAPGCYDAFSAKLVEEAGFEALYMTGYGTSATMIGQPDVGLLTMSEMVTRAGQIVSAVHIPVIADADTGYGNPINVIRTVREYIKAGVAAIQLEDQVIPKRCGHTRGKQLIPKEEMVKKIEAAVDVRGDSGLVLIARTDANAVNGFEDAITRCQAYIRAGADIIFVEAPRSIEEMHRVYEELHFPLMANMVEKGQTPLLKNQELEELGYKLVIYPLSTLMAAAKAMRELLRSLKKNGTTREFLSHMIEFPEMSRICGFDEFYKMEQKYCHLD